MANRLSVVSIWEWHQAERDRRTYYSACERWQSRLSRVPWRIGRVLMWAGGGGGVMRHQLWLPVFTRLLPPFLFFFPPTLVYSSSACSWFICFDLSSLTHPQCLPFSRSLSCTFFLSSPFLCLHQDCSGFLYLPNSIYEGQLTIQTSDGCYKL